METRELAGDRSEAMAIRQRVFVEEQGVPPEEEADHLDDAAIHVLTRVEGRPAGTARMVVEGDRGKIGRVAVLPEFRGRGVGVALMEALTRRARLSSLRELYLDAQVEALRFYERLGYTAEGPEFLDAGIVHRRMRRRL